MKAGSTFAALLWSAILLALVPRPAAADVLLMLSDGAGTATANCAGDAEFHQPGEACGHMGDCTENCPSNCLSVTSHCCASGLLVNSFQKPLAIATLLVTTEVMPDCRNGIEPERLAEPP